MTATPFAGVAADPAPTRGFNSDRRDAPGMSPDDEVPDDSDTTADDAATTEEADTTAADSDETATGDGTDEPAHGGESGAEPPSDGDDGDDGGDQATTPAGREKADDEKFCHDCGTAIEAGARFCPECGAPQDDTDADTPEAGASGGQTDKDRVTAGVFAILLGGLGVHHFYLGNVGRGVLYLCFFWTGIPALAGLIEGILYLIKTDAEFEAQYVEE